VLFRHLLRTSNSERGISIIEMLASIAISGLVVGVAFSGFDVYRQSFVRDQSRSSVNQSLTGVSSLIGPDILQIGQGLTDDPNFEAVSVVQTNIPGTNDKSSVITITKALVSASLPICADIDAGTTDDITVMDTTDPDLGGCSFVDNLPRNTPDGWPDILKIFRDNRVKSGGSARAYIYDGSENYEIFDYTDETYDSSKAFMETNTHTWQHDYSKNGTGRIHIVEQRTYFLHRKDGEDTGALKLIVDPPQEIVDGDLSNVDDYDTLTLAENIANFEVVVSLIEDVTEDTTYECRVIPPGDDECLPDEVSYSWANIQYIEMITTLAPEEEELRRSSLTEEDLVLTERFFPRNVFSF